MIFLIIWRGMAPFQQLDLNNRARRESRSRREEIKMEKICSERWGFTGNQHLIAASQKTLKSYLMDLIAIINPEDPRTVIPLAHGDPSVFPVFRTSIDAENAVVDSLRTGQYNSYSNSDGIPPAKSAVADFLNRKLVDDKITADDVFMTLGCNQAIEIMLSVITRPGANILLPRPAFPQFEARAVSSCLEVRHFDLLPEKDWEIDLDAVERIADENTVAMVIINPNNPCGNVYTYDQLKKVAKTAKKLRIMVISDEVYDHSIYGGKPFTPMGTFASIVPIFTLGAISKGWVVSGWKVGWIAAHDPYGIFKRTGVIKSLKACLDIVPDAITFLQGALRGILENTKEDFFEETNAILKKNVEYTCDVIKGIPCLNVVKKPDSCTYLLVKLDATLLEDISDDLEFCAKLAKEESLLVLPGRALNIEQWVRITIGVDPSVLEDGLGRLTAFCERHAEKDPAALLNRLTLSNGD